jgi:alcohol dehydrogenase class IV
MIFDNLRTACHDGANLEARENMALASTYAGMAFTRANVGYVHAIAHQFGGRYHTPHGLANALMLPHVLRISVPAVTAQLARLAVRARLGDESDGDEVLAERFIDGVVALERDIGLPTTLAALREADIPALAKAALHEAHTGYPVPRYLTQDECEQLIRAVLPPEAAAAPKAAKAERKAPARKATATKAAAARTPTRKATARKAAART